MRSTPEFRELMEEPPGGCNAGRAASADPNVEGRHVALVVDSVQALDFVRGGGWSIIAMAGGERQRSGMTAHRGALRGDEYVDGDAVRAEVEARLGFTIDDVHAAYRQGRLSSERAGLRAQIDARLLGLSRQGTNMVALARVLELRVRTGRNGGGDDCPVIDAALRRAKAAELSTEGSQ